MIGVGARFACAVAVVALALCGCAPQPEPLPERVSAEEMEALVKERLSWVFQPRPYLERPEAHFERFITVDEREEVLEGCFAELGTDVTVTEYGNFAFTAMTQEETDAQLAAMYICLVRFPEDWWADAALSERERAFLYDYSAAVVVPCVRSAGYPVPPLPDRDDYIAENAYWWAYQLVETGESGSADELRLANLMLRCPEKPAGWNER